MFPKLRNHLSLSKLPYVFHADAGTIYRVTHQTSETGKLFISIPKTQRRLKELHDNLEDSGDEARHELFTIIRSLAALEDNYEEDHGTSKGLLTLRQALAVAAAMAYKSKKRLLIASESLSNSIYTLYPDLRNGKWKTDPPPLEAEIITREWKALTNGEIPMVSFALRSPISHLCSRYVRYYSNAKQGGINPLKPETWIAKQVEIDGNSRQHSGIFPALHKSYIKYHSRLGYCRPYGFKELVESLDVCATIGLSGEQCMRFTDLPKENESIIKPDDLKILESRVVAALDLADYLQLVLNEQVME